MPNLTQDLTVHWVKTRWKCRFWNKTGWLQTCPTLCLNISLFLLSHLENGIIPPKVIMRIRKEYMLSSRNVAMSKPHKSVYYSNHSFQKEGNMEVSG